MLRPATKSLSISDQLIYARRELKRRETAFPHLVRNKKLREEIAISEIKAQREIIKTLVLVQSAKATIELKKRQSR